MAEAAPRRLRTIGMIALAIALVVVVVGIARRRQSEQDLTQWTAAQASPPVTIVTPTMVSAKGALTLPAAVQAFNSAPIYARTNGYVRRWLVDIGDPVRAGQLLAILDAPEVDQQVVAAQAELATARANAALAKSTADRWAAMLAKDAVSRQEADEKAGDLAAKTAVVNAAQAGVARLSATQGFTRLTAPFAGVITSRSTQVGALVSSGTAAAQPLFTVADVSRMRIYVRVPQIYSGQIHPGMHVTLALPEYPARSFDAELTRTAGAVDPTSGTVLVELVAANGDRALKPGAYAQASFPLAAAAGHVMLPASALIVGAGGTQVAVLGPGNRAELKTISLGRDDGTQVEVASGLSARDRVIDNPPDALQSGDVVRVARDGGKGKQAKAADAAG